MSGYEVVVDALRAAGSAATSAGEQAEKIDLAGTLTGVGGALPGSRSVHAATGAADTWRRQLMDWSTGTKKLGQGMSSSADHYAASEHAAVDLFGAPSWR
ncbi:MAG: hypothetical protein ACRDTC_01255 [Pseudonocardiaceae bacterium]